MYERDETMLFSAVAVLLAALTIGGLAEAAYPHALSAANAREVHVSRSAACAPAAAAART